MSKEEHAFDPSQLLPRDETGSYLHLKLKRYASIKDLTMPYAEKTWQEYPHDAEIDLAPSARSKCRQCHLTIAKSHLRARLWLQCHKGCKNSAYFHGKDCIWKYPETNKIQVIDEFVGFDKLPSSEQQFFRKTFEEFARSNENMKRKSTKLASDTAKPRKKAKKSN